MRFGPLPTTGALGGILAHSVRLPDGGRLSKGTRLAQEDIEVLLSFGIVEVTVAMPDPHDVVEDHAAQRMAEALAGAGVSVRAPRSGRCNLRADARGVLTANATAIHALNRLDESIAVATLPQDSPVERGDLIATVKVIPFAVSAPMLEAYVAVAARSDAPVIQVSAYQPRSVALIQSTTPETAAEALGRDLEVVRSRVERLGSRLASTTTCPHGPEELSAALGRALDEGFDPVVILGAVAIGDRADVVPSALVNAGGTVLRFGVPLDPGHLVLIGRRGHQVVLGMPGCARSPGRNGFDRILESVLAGRSVETIDLAGMGVGGLARG